MAKNRMLKLYIFFKNHKWWKEKFLWATFALNEKLVDYVIMLDSQSGWFISTYSHSFLGDKLIKNRLHIIDLMLDKLNQNELLLER